MQEGLAAQLVQWEVDKELSKPVQRVRYQIVAFQLRKPLAHGLLL